MRAYVRLCAAVLLWASLAATAWAQGLNVAIVGVVRDTSGGVLPGATVTVRNVATDQVVATTVTGAEGEYAVRNLAPPRYAVEASLQGFRPVTNARVDVTIGTTVRVESEMQEGRGAGAAGRARPIRARPVGHLHSEG